MRTDGAERPDLAFRRTDDDARLAAELEDGGQIEAQRAGAAGDDALRGGFAARRRNQEARDRVRDRHGRRHKPDGEERVEEHAPIEV